MRTWEVLGIAPTEDQREIEAAFEQQLKFVDPEQDPESWHQLREAYEDALQQARLGAPSARELMSDDPDMAPEIADTSMPEPASPEAELRAGQVMTELESIFTNPAWRNDMQRWRAQLESERAHKPGVTEVLRFSVFDFLMRQSSPGQPAVSEDILGYLDQRLGWSEHKGQLLQRFSASQVSVLMGDASAGTGQSHAAASPLDMPQQGDQSEVPSAPKGLGIALVGWVIALMILTIIFSEMGG